MFSTNHPFGVVRPSHNHNKKDQRGLDQTVHVLCACLKSTWGNFLTFLQPQTLWNLSERCCSSSFAVKPCFISSYKHCCASTVLPCKQTHNRSQDIKTWFRIGLQWAQKMISKNSFKQTSFMELFWRFRTDVHILNSLFRPVQSCVYML